MTTETSSVDEKIKITKLDLNKLDKRLAGGAALGVVVLLAVVVMFFTRGDDAVITSSSSAPVAQGYDLTEAPSGAAVPMATNTQAVQDISAAPMDLTASPTDVTAAPRVMNVQTSELSGIEESKFSDKDVTKWVRKVVPKIMSFGYKDYEKVTKKTARHFNLQGQKSFSDAAAKAGLVEQLNKFEMRMVTKLDGKPEIINKKFDGQKWSWVLQMPVVTRYVLPDSEKERLGYVLVVVDESREKQNKDGLGIRQWITQPRK